MSLRIFGTTIGAGLAALFVIGAITTVIAEQFLEPAFLIGLGVGVLGGVIVMVAVYSEMTSRPTAGTERLLFAIAVFGYTAILLLLIQSLIEGLEEILSIFIIVGIAIVIGGAVYAYLSMTAKTYSPMEG